MSEQANVATLVELLTMARHSGEKQLERKLRKILRVEHGIRITFPRERNSASK